MALISITLRDADDGTVDLSLETEPPFRKGEEMSPAQSMALTLLEAAAGVSDSYSVKQPSV